MGDGRLVSNPNHRAEWSPEYFAALSINFVDGRNAVEMRFDCGLSDCLKASAQRLVFLLDQRRLAVG